MDEGWKVAGLSEVKIKSSRLVEGQVAEGKAGNDSGRGGCVDDVMGLHLGEDELTVRRKSCDSDGRGERLGGGRV